MGLDHQLFVSPVDEELTCPICDLVLEHPLQANACDHIFCCVCINEWLLNSNHCPVDHSPLDTDDLLPVPIIISNQLQALQVKCTFEKYGCSQIVNLGSLTIHANNCYFKNGVEDYSVNPNPVSLIRSETAVCLNELRNLQRSVTDIKEHLIVNQRRTIELSEIIDDLGIKLDESQRTVNEIFDPIVALILTVDRCDESVSDDGQCNQMIAINIHNLSEFTNEALLFEYLRQNDVMAENIEKNSTLFARSVNFVVTVRNDDKSKIMDSKLWPIGVTVFVRGEKRTAVNGSRSKHEPATVTIKAGITCWSQSITEN